MRRFMTCLMYVILVVLITIGISIVVFRSCARRSIEYETGVRREVSPPVGWSPTGRTIAEPEVIVGPSTGYVTTPTEEPKKKEPRSVFIVPPGTLGEGGDVRELIPDVEFTGPEPGSAASEACDD